LIICWDTLNLMRYSRKTKMWYNNSGGGYIEVDKCLCCGENFLSREGLSKFCSPKCKNKGKFNPMYGKTHTTDVKLILKENFKKSQNTIKLKYGVDNPSYLDSVKLKKGQIIINFENCSNIVSIEKFKLLSLKGNNQNSIMTLLCQNNHKFNIKWNAWKRGSRCSKCYFDKLFNESNKNYNDFKLYKKLVCYLTEKNYKTYKHIINTSESKRSRDNHLDHKFSIIEGFKNNILPIIIADPINLEVIGAVENCSKQDKCSITMEQLLNEYSRKNRGNPVSM